MALTRAPIKPDISSLAGHFSFHVETTTSLSFLFFCPPPPRLSTLPVRLVFEERLGERRGCTSLFKRPPSPRYFYIPRRGTTTTTVFVPFVFVPPRPFFARPYARGGEGRGTAEVAICYNLLYRYRGLRCRPTPTQPPRFSLLSLSSTFPPSSLASPSSRSLSLSFSSRYSRRASTRATTTLSTRVNIFRGREG